MSIILGDFREYLSQYKDKKNHYVVSDPPYNQGYHYNRYRDNLHDSQYYSLLQSAFNTLPSVVISYPEETINILSRAIESYCTQSVSWIYNSNTASPGGDAILIFEKYPSHTKITTTSALKKESQKVNTQEVMIGGILIK